MLTITDGGSLARALGTPLDPRIKRLLIERRQQLGGRIDGEARFIVVQPGDSIQAVEKELGFSPLQNQTDSRIFGDPEFTPSWEWITAYGFCFELCFIFDDSGFAHVLIVENKEKADAKLLELCASDMEAKRPSGRRKASITSK